MEKESSNTPAVGAIVKTENPRFVIGLFDQFRSAMKLRRLDTKLSARESLEDGPQALINIHQA
jgi:hypothetical protein